ncbi:sugar transporter domain-containing protein [Ditylenchus destructor]|uniref:Sugar transporter domain-containing protein n=1 Tax=Ditylenchus destructor TaxID=166010 RepID=A0AAD4N3Y5_9BILA|nr:sugar transporter domain-containing protein [Ditylenchus destructor]
MTYTNTAEKSFRDFIDESYTRRGYPLSPDAAMWLWSFVLNCFLAGNFIGGIFTPLLTDNLGRRFTLVFGMIGNTAACVLGSVAISLHSPELFILSRVFGGAMSSVNFGGLTLILMECPPTELRGTCFFASGTTFAAAMLIGTLAGMKEALGSNIFLLVGHNIDTNKLIEDIRLEEEDETTDKSSWVILKEMFTIPYLRTAMYLGLCALQLINGIWPITYEVLEAHFSGQMSGVSASVYLGVNLVAGALGTLVIGRVSRKWMLILSGFANIIALGFYIGFDRMFDLNTRLYGMLCLSAILVYYLSNGIGFGVISFYITGELLPQLHRSLGQTVVFSISLLVSFALSMVTLPAYESYNVWVFIPLFIVPNGLCLFYLWAYLPETRGREIHEIVAELKMLHGKGTSRKNTVCSNTKLDAIS